MKICTKCHQQKELDQFQKYWHSSQQKERTRGHCTECFYKQRNERRSLKRKEAELIQVSIKEELIQPVQPELQPAILENNPNYKLCRTCQEYLELDKFYHHKSRKKTAYLDCRSCINKKEVDKAREDRQKYLIENGGSDQHKQKPGEWVDEYQKEATFNILKAIGWKLNEDNGIWWKDGIKTPEGVFMNIKPKINKKFILGIYPENVRAEKGQEMFDEMVKMRMKGDSYYKIADKFNISQTTAYKWLNDKSYE